MVLHSSCRKEVFCIKEKIYVSVPDSDWTNKSKISDANRIKGQIISFIERKNIKIVILDIINSWQRPIEQRMHFIAFKICVTIFDLLWTNTGSISEPWHRELLLTRSGRCRALKGLTSPWQFSPSLLFLTELTIRKQFGTKYCFWETGFKYTKCLGNKFI